MKKRFLIHSYNKFNRETYWLHQQFSTTIDELAASNGTNSYARLSSEMAVIRLHDAWSRFCREVIILSASGAYTASGIRLSTVQGVRKITDVIPCLLKTYKKRKFEPNWGHTDQCIDAAKRLNIQNFSTVVAAISVTDSPVKQLRTIRNFFAHRNKDSAEEVRKLFTMTYKINKVNIESVAGKLIPSGITLFEDWVVTLQLIAGISIQ